MTVPPRTRFSTPLILAAALVLPSLTTADDGPQPAAASEPVQSSRRYLRVEYMQVPDGGDEKYREVERAWKKIHQARHDAGHTRGWALLKVDRQGPVPAPYQYVTVHILETLDGVTKNRIRPNLTEEDREILQGTQATRKMLGADVWEFRTTAMPDRGLEGAAKQFLIGLMKSKHEEEHLKLEKEAWRLGWRKAAEDGHIWNWSVWSRHVQDGEDDSFNMAAIVSFPESHEAKRLTNASQKSMRAAFTSEKHAEILARTEAARDMVAYERWKVVDATQDPIAAEWRKLAGAWRAELPGGRYRIKRISRGREVLEVYGSDGVLARRSQAEMEITRASGLNFFTVRNWRGTDGDDETVRPGEYTTVYKVHDGKWYEQRRGIFSASSGSAPDEFLIYQRIDADQVN